jgi:hypothetical protein
MRARIVASPRDLGRHQRATFAFGSSVCVMIPLSTNEAALGLAIADGSEDVDYPIASAAEFVCSVANAR